MAAQTGRRSGNILFWRGKVNEIDRSYPAFAADRRSVCVQAAWLACGARIAAPSMRRKRLIPAPQFSPAKKGIPQRANRYGIASDSPDVVVSQEPRNEISCGISPK
jgi:hypothetical protein